MDEYRRARLFMELGRPAQAARILEAVVVAEPGNTDIRLRLALAYFASAQLSKAEELRSSGHATPLTIRRFTRHDNSSRVVERLGNMAP